MPLDPKQDCCDLQTLNEKVRIANIGDTLFQFLVFEIVEGDEGTLDGAAFSLMRAVRNSLAAAGVKGFEPVVGFEAESMVLSGYVPDTYLDESCIKTSGTGTAVAKFSQPSGVYDISISYAGEKIGEGSLALSVGGRQKLAWRLNEGAACWRRKTIPQIAIQSGDEIQITGVAGGSEGARVDFIEFIPRNLLK